MDKKFGGLIWTNHAVQRLRERKIKQNDAWLAWRYPDRSKYSKAKGAWIYYKVLKNEKIGIVAKRNEKMEWVVLSVWTKPLTRGKNNKSFWERIFGVRFF